VESLKRTLAALRAQDAAFDWEGVVVDDGSEPPVPGDVTDGLSGQVVRGPGQGPGKARNLGIANARGAIVAFTDDDTEPHPTWLRGAVEQLESQPQAAGVEGPVSSPAWDPLHAHSLAAEEPGNYWTCNVAYRREILRRLQGFDESFGLPHCEDLDLAYRALEHGPIAFSPAMRITHHPRAVPFRAAARRGRMTASEVPFFRRHRHRFGRASRLPAPLFPFVSAITMWLPVLRREARHPRRLARAAALFAAYLGYVLVGAVRAQ
jgi:GT2 family glycosyltransferase